VKRREEKGENNKKDPKNIKKPKKLGHMVALLHNLTPKILPEGSAKLRWAGRGRGPHIS
jgi:hypothetical protein